MKNALRDAIIAYTDAHSGTNGVYGTEIANLALIRGDRETPAAACVLRAGTDRRRARIERIAAW